MATKTKTPCPPVVVCISDDSFTPRSVNIKPGESVRFENHGGSVHSVNFVNFGGGAPSDSGDIQPDDTHTITFPTEGIFGFGCEHVPTMTGEVCVSA